MFVKDIHYGVRCADISCASGGIGRREGLKIPWMNNPCGFDSRLAHQLKTLGLSWGFYLYCLTLNTPKGYYKNMKADIKSRAIRRLKIAEGQIRGLQAMVEDEKYCIDIITQASAIKEALSGVEDLLLENHLETHVIHQAKNGQEDQAIEEVLKVYKLKRKK